MNGDLMNDFTFYSPTEFVFGCGMTDHVGEKLQPKGYKRVLLVYGKGSVVRSGTLDRVKKSLEAQGIEYADLAGVRPNPEVNQVREGIDIARAFDADCVLAVGGGSTIDCAKAISIGVYYDGDVWDFFSGKATATKCLPVCCVLTIPAAGSEGSNSCVISNDEINEKNGLGNELFRPVVSIMDPELTFTLPQYQTAAGITDMIAHICERYFSGAPAVPVTDNIACGLIRAIIDSAEKLVDNPQDYDARANIMWAGTLAHNDLAGCGRAKGGRAGGWESHALEHALSAINPKVAHGAGLAVIMPAWMRYVWHEDPQRFLSFGYDVFGIEPKDGLDSSIEEAVESMIAELQDFFARQTMPTTLGELGFTEADVDTLVDIVIAAKGNPFGVFKPLAAEDAKAIYLSAF